MNGAKADTSSPGVPAFQFTDSHTMLFPSFLVPRLHPVRIDTNCDMLKEKSSVLQYPRHHELPSILTLFLQASKAATPYSFYPFEKETLLQSSPTIRTIARRENPKEILPCTRTPCQIGRNISPPCIFTKGHAVPPCTMRESAFVAQIDTTRGWVVRTPRRDFVLRNHPVTRVVTRKQKQKRIEPLNMFPRNTGPTGDLPPSLQSLLSRGNAPFTGRASSRRPSEMASCSLRLG